METEGKTELDDLLMSVTGLEYYGYETRPRSPLVLRLLKQITADGRSSASERWSQTEEVLTRLVGMVAVAERALSDALAVAKAGHDGLQGLCEAVLEEDVPNGGWMFQLGKIAGDLEERRLQVLAVSLAFRRVHERRENAATTYDGIRSHVGEGAGHATVVDGANSAESLGKQDGDAS